MMKILIAVDGSAGAMKATKHVATHLNWFQGTPEIHLVNVQVPVGAYRTRGLLSDDDVANFYREEAKAALALSIKTLRKREIAFQSTYLVGRIADEIRAYAKKHKIDMIVMGSHGNSALENLVMGSTATKILATTAVPVLIVR